MELLKLTWWMEDPIDFEYKQYILLDYLQKIERYFYNKDFSPYLLHTEKLYEEMAISLEFIETFEKSITKKELIFTQSGLGWKEQKPPTIDEVEEMKNILRFSIPKIKEKVQLGKELWKQGPTILW
jgi:hypothetical protein|tara:strand:- start:1130 stop:1507 length:378 start_codon:yes stop_codon:yes gene_type:complete